MKMLKNFLLVIYFITVLFTKTHLQPISEENLTEINTEKPQQFEDNQKILTPQDLDEETKLKCKHYYEVFLQVLKAMESAYSIKDDVKVNNVGVQNLPYPERKFFNLNPDKNLQKPNSKGPQYVPLDPQCNELNYLQPPLETNPIQFSHQNQEFMNVSPLSLQNSLVSDGKMAYLWYKTIPNYQNYIKTYNNNKNINNQKIGIDKIGENEFSTSSATEPIPLSLQNSWISDPQMAYLWYKIIRNNQISTKTNNNNKNINNQKIGIDKIDENEFSTTTEPTSTTVESTTTTSSTEPIKIEEIKPNLYEHQLKFVFPVQFPNPQVINVPYDMDPYAYYPRELQPEFVYLQMPYVPTFHMIKRLTVPHNHEIETSLDDVTS